MRSSTQMWELYGRVASHYRNAIRDGHPPTKTVATRLGISHTYAANLIAKARAAGRLDATTRGVAHAKVDRQ